MLVDWVSGHFGDILRCLSLNVESNECVRHKVMDRLEPLLPNKVLPVVEQSVVEGLVSEPGLRHMDIPEVKCRGEKS